MKFGVSWSIRQVVEGWEGSWVFLLFMKSLYTQIGPASSKLFNNKLLWLLKNLCDLQYLVYPSKTLKTPPCTYTDNCIQIFNSIKPVAHRILLESWGHSDSTSGATNVSSCGQASLTTHEDPTGHLRRKIDPLLNPYQGFIILFNVDIIDYTFEFLFPLCSLFVHYLGHCCTRE